MSSSSSSFAHSLSLRIPKFSFTIFFMMTTLLQLSRRSSSTGVSAWMATTKTTRSSSARVISSLGRTRFSTIPSSTVASLSLSVSASAPVSNTCLEQYYSSSSTSSSSTTRLFSTTSSDDSDEEEDAVFTTTTFDSVGIQTPILLERLTNELGLDCRPTKVQAGTFGKLVRETSTATTNEDEDEDDDNEERFQTRKRAKNVIIGSETGSGKTLAYLLPLLDDILQQKKVQHEGQLEGRRTSLSYDYARAVILVPNKELVQQVLRMAVPLCGGPHAVVWSGGTTQVGGGKRGKDSPKCPEHQLVRLAVFPGGLKEPMDFKPFRDTVALGGGTEPAVDLIVSTPAALGPLALSPKHIDMFADIETLVVDEADMLLDGGYIRPLENVLMGFKRADRLDPSMGVPPTQHVFCAATLPDMGLKSVDAYLQKKFPYAERVQMSGMHNARHYGLKQATQWIGPVETKKERMEQFIEMLETPVEEGGLLGEKVMVFLNSVEDVEGAQGALDTAGISSVPYHAKIKLDERSQMLDRFRKYDSSSSSDDPKDDSVSVLVCTDLASRGLDVPGVNAVVQLQFSGNVVSHLHRMGRCGRAGQRTGRGIVFYNDAEAELVEVVKEAENQQERMVLEGDVDDQFGDEDSETSGKVKKAFSRKRGFTKKRKKLKRGEMIQPYDVE